MKHFDYLLRKKYRIGTIGWFSLFLVVLVVAALVTFWFFLADYQSSLPKNLANQIFDAYQSGDVETIGGYCTNLPTALKNQKEFAKYYSGNTNLNDLYFYPGAATDPSEFCYEFASGGDRVATLTLCKTGITSSFGFPLYEIASIKGYPLFNYKITTPGDTVLFADGKLLSERYRTDEGSKIDNFSALTGTTFKTKTYEITDFFYLEELGVFSKDDSDCTVTWSEDRHGATVEKLMDAEKQKEISEFAVQFSEVYSVFATRQNGARNPVLQLLQPGTPFYGALLLYNNDWGEAYSNDRYENRVVDRLVQYSPTEFSCDIQFDYVIKFRDGFEKTYPYSMTYYLTNRSGRLLLVDMQAQS